MAPRGAITMTAVLLCFILGPLGPDPATCSQMGNSCCTEYNRKPVPFQRIKGYREQTLKENCHIEAIIFYMVTRKEICATRSDAWVRKALELLSSKLKKMSKAVPAAGETLMKKRTNRPSGDGSGSLSLTTETFQNNTGRFY